MKTKNFFVVKLVAVTIMLGFLSPTISIQEVERPVKLASAVTYDMPQGILEKLSTSEFTITLFTQAEARKKRRYKKQRRKARRSANRRSNYRHHRKRERRRDVLGAVVVGAVVGAVINEATQD